LCQGVPAIRARQGRVGTVIDNSAYFILILLRMLLFKLTNGRAAM
jgi:hypothetical protein